MAKFRTRYAEYEMPQEKTLHYDPEQVVQFRNLKVESMETKNFSTGRRISIKVRNSKYTNSEGKEAYKTYWLHAFEDGGVLGAIENSVQVGDLISVFCVPKNNKKVEGGKTVYQTSYQIIPNDLYDDRIPENGYFFKLAKVARPIKEKKENPYAENVLSTQEIIERMIG